MRRLHIILLFTILLNFSWLKASDFTSLYHQTEESTDQTEIVMAGNRLIVRNLPEDGVLEIFSIVGVKVYTKEIKRGTNEYALNLPKGYYIIRIGKIAKKIALR